MAHKTITKIMAASALSTLLLSGCGSGTTGFSESATSSSATESTSSSTILSDKEVASLKFMREEEKLARDTYLTLYASTGLNIFNNIASSEQTHTDAILALMQTYNVEDPVQSQIGVFTDQSLQSLYDTLVVQGESNDLEALRVGALIEETDIQDIVHAMNDIEQADILATYENLLCGSRNHLRSFVKNIENKGDVYSTQIQEMDDVVTEILSTSLEQCGN